MALRAFGRLDGALVSVGGPPPAPVLGTTDEQWTTAFDRVFLAALRVPRVVARTRPRPTSPRLGAVDVGPLPVPGLARSNGLRPGLGMLVKQLADELGPDGTGSSG